ncbi:hypothetical protein ACFX2F_019449 [Malus domestica]
MSRGISVRVRNFRRGCLLADEHTAPLEVGVGLRAAVGFLLRCRALSGKSHRARLFGQGSSGKAESEGQR